MTDPRLLPSIGIAVCGVVWGLFWIPVRFMEAQGLHGAWPCAVFFAASVALMVPFVLRRTASLQHNVLELAIAGVLCGGAFALYIMSLLYTDVVHAILLFYLTPVWSTLAGRWWLGVRITRVRVGVLLAGLMGLYVILGAGATLPTPQKAGDWMALVSGMFWAGGSMYLYRGMKSDYAEQLFGFAAGGLVVTAVLILVLGGGEGLTATEWRWPAVVAGVALAAVLMPANFIVFWGAARLEPARVGILLMMEVLVGVISAALYAGEPFGWREVLGASLIVGAGILEVAQRGQTRDGPPPR